MSFAGSGQYVWNSWTRLVSLWGTNLYLHYNVRFSHPLATRQFLFNEQADVLEYYDQTVSSPQGSFYIPAVLQVHMHLLFDSYKRWCPNFACFRLVMFYHVFIFRFHICFKLSREDGLDTILVEKAYFSGIFSLASKCFLFIIETYGIAMMMHLFCASVQYIITLDLVIRFFFFNL